jgi:transcriptional antiterminator RfaH
MPLLLLEPFLYPDGLFAEAGVDTEADAAWWVLHTRPRAEKALARKLLNFRRDFFLPLCKREWLSRGRLLSSYLPLFPGYVFLRGDDETRLQALQTNLVAHVLPVADAERLHVDLARIHRLMLEDSRMEPEDRLLPGMAVKIVSGPLRGLEGKVLRRGKHLRFFVEVQLLQRGVSVEIDSSMIRPLAQTDLVGRGDCQPGTDASFSQSSP